jgi:hypothetical protein
MSMAKARKCGQARQQVNDWFDQLKVSDWFLRQHEEK